MDDDTPGDTAPQTHALTAVGVTAGVPTVGPPILRTRVVPDGWVSLDAALAWVAFETSVPMHRYPYLGANEWHLFTPDRVVSVLREFASCRDRDAMEPVRAMLPDGTFSIIAATAALRCPDLPYPFELAKAAQILADELAANLQQANEQHAILTRAAHRLRRAIAFHGMPAYGWREARYADKGPLGLPLLYISDPRERVPPGEVAAPVTLVGNVILANLWDDWDDDADGEPIKLLWRGVVIDADDLLAAFPAPDDGAPTIAYHLTPPEKPKRGGGRPPHQGRQTFRKAMMRRANSPDGLGDMPDCARAMIQWAAATFGDRAPSETTIREWVREDWPED